MFSQFLRRHTVSLVVAASSLVSLTASATIVEFETSQGNFKVNLHDQATPKTVENFLRYVNDGRYVDSIIHRSIEEFIVQGGGFSFDGEIADIPTFATVENEPVYSNVKGTIAMAKTPSDPNSATSQWFVNLDDNSSNLDLQNSGFTVFGEVIEDGLTVLEDITELNKCSSQISTDLPMPNYDCASGLEPGADNFVIVHSVIIIDSSPTTADSLSPIKNTLITPTEPTPTEPSSGGGGGSFVWLSFALLGLTLRKLALKVKG